MSVELFFRWYDLWVGAYYDRINRVLYICPIPMFGVKLSRRRDPVKAFDELYGCDAGEPRKLLNLAELMT